MCAASTDPPWFVVVVVVVVVSASISTWASRRWHWRFCIVLRIMWLSLSGRCLTIRGLVMCVFVCASVPRRRQSGSPLGARVQPAADGGDQNPSGNRERRSRASVSGSESAHDEAAPTYKTVAMAITDREADARFPSTLRRSCAHGKRIRAVGWLGSVMRL
jgi:hypothetical protein